MIKSLGILFSIKSIDMISTLNSKSATAGEQLSSEQWSLTTTWSLVSGHGIFQTEYDKEDWGWGWKENEGEGKEGSDHHTLTLATQSTAYGPEQWHTSSAACRIHCLQHCGDVVPSGVEKPASMTELQENVLRD